MELKVNWFNLIWIEELKRKLKGVESEVCGWVESRDLEKFEVNDMNWGELKFLKYMIVVYINFIWS